MQAEWTLDHFLGYLGTWSATQRYQAEQRANPVDLVRDDLAHAWGVHKLAKKVSWPLSVRIGKMQ
ncbi:MAG: hypothetical protein ACE5I1_27930 [bacterium]